MCAEQLSVHTGGECHGKGEGEGDADADADAAAAVDAAADNDDDDGSDQGMSPAAFALALRAQLPCASQRAAFSGVEALPHPRQRVVEVAPAGGTLVLFDSVAVIHEVRHPCLHMRCFVPPFLLTYKLTYFAYLTYLVRCCPPTRESELRWRAGSTRPSRTSPSGMMNECSLTRSTRESGVSVILGLTKGKTDRDSLWGYFYQSSDPRPCGAG